MREIKRYLILIFLAAGLGYGFFHFSTWRLSHEFALHKIQSSLIPSPQWELSSPAPPHLSEILNQDFFYLDKGSQCYVFESRDGKHVLKFFRHDRYRLPKFTQRLTLPTFLDHIKKKRLRNKEAKREALFSSCKIAYEELAEESGLIYAHLNKSSHLQTTVTIRDSLQRSYVLKLDNYEFLIQKKAESLYPYFTRLIRSKKHTEAEVALANLIALISRRVEKGVADHDAMIHKNLGFSGGKALFLDVGQFSHILTVETSEELLLTTARFRRWLRERSPELADTFDVLLQRS